MSEVFETGVLDVNVEFINKILNESYEEFKNKWGEKHSEHIKELQDTIRGIEKDPYWWSTEVSGSAGISTHKIWYCRIHKLSPVLKHELWHLYNNEGELLKYALPEHIEQLEKDGYFKRKYERTIEIIKERFKNNPNEINSTIKFYEGLTRDQFNDIFFPERAQVEMWTEWFNCETHTKDMQNNFWNWGDGYFTKKFSSDSFYDSFINIADMISCVMPKEKLLDMYLQTSNYKTACSYPEMVREFDMKYEDALNENEKEDYKYPYLKLILNIDTINDNARKNSVVAREALQSAMTTCFKAYLIKLDKINIQEMNLEKAQEIYSEIKYMQEQMVWNIDISKMQKFEYTKVMEKIQEKFEYLVQEANIESVEVTHMINTIDYTNNPYALIENGKEIYEKIIEIPNSNKGQLVDINGYKANTKNGNIKKNLYASVHAILEDQSFNLLFENFNDEKGNLLSYFYELIENITNRNDVVNIYNEIYKLYYDKLNNTLNTDENITNLFKKYSKSIIILQENALFDDKKQKYLPQLEEIINIYNERLQIYKENIDKSTEELIQLDLSNGLPEEEAKRFPTKEANNSKNKLNEQRNNIIEQRKEQFIEYQKLLSPDKDDDDFRE